MQSEEEMDAVANLREKFPATALAATLFHWKGSPGVRNYELKCQGSATIKFQNRGANEARKVTILNELT